MTEDRWWHPYRHAARRPLLLKRDRIKTAIRDWFAQRQFVEIEAAILQVSPGNETHLHALATERVGADGRTAGMFLHTSPEFAAKKLLAAGETKIFEFARVFRNREQGALNATEFTMLEWYCVGASYRDAMDDAAALLSVAAAASGADQFSFLGLRVDPTRPAERIPQARRHRPPRRRPE